MNRNHFSKQISGFSAPHQMENNRWRCFFLKIALLIFVQELSTFVSVSRSFVVKNDAIQFAPKMKVKRKIHLPQKSKQVSLLSKFCSVSSQIPCASSQLTR